MPHLDKRVSDKIKKIIGKPRKQATKKKEQEKEIIALS